MQKAPHRKSLLVFQKSLSEHLERALVRRSVDILHRDSVLVEELVEQSLKGRLLQCFLDQRRNPPVLRHDLHEVVVAHPRHCLDGAELRALRPARGAEVSTELRESLGWERLERRELGGDDMNERVDTLDGGQSAERIVGFEQGDERGQLVKNQLEPQLARLVHDDEEKLVGMFGYRPGALQAEQLIKCKIRGVRDLRIGSRRIGPLRQNVDTSSVVTSSTRIVSVV